MKVLLPAGVLILILGCAREEPVPPPSTTTAPETQPLPAPVPPAPAQPAVSLPAGSPIPAEGVLLWLTADDALTTASEGKLTVWQNALVPNASAAPAFAGRPPAVVAGSLNGHAVIRFDGTDQLLKSTVDIRPTTLPEGTVITVFTSATAEASPLRKLYGNDDGGYDRAVGLDDRGSGTNFTLFAGNGVAPYFPLTAGAPYVLVDEYGPKEFSGWVNGKAAATKLEAAWGEDANPNLHIGGSGTTYGEYWQGDLAEMIVYARRLTAAERTRVEDYLGGKYGVGITRDVPVTTGSQ